MANNISVTQGAGKTVATEEISSVQYQKVKLIDPSLGSVDPIGVAANPLQVSLANTGANGTPVVVSGAVTTGGLTDTQLRATPVPVSGTFFQATQPVSAASLPLPTGASTAALQTQPGVDIGDVTVNNAAGAAAVNIQDGGNSITVDGPLTDTQLRAVAVPVSGTVTTTNAGTFAVQESGTQVQVDDAAFTPATSKIVMGGFLADETGTDSVDEGDGGAARITLDRKLIVTVEPHTAGGWDTFMASSADGSTALTNTAQAIKASAGKLGGWYIYNPNAAAIYVSIYDVAAAGVTVGTTNPKMSLTIPATSAANLELVNGISFGTAISAAATTTGGGNTAPGTALEANFWFK